VDGTRPLQPNLTDRDSEGKYPESLKDHIEQAWKNVEAALIDAGGKGLDEVYSINTYHCPMSEESLMVCVEYVKKHMPHKPIWTAVGVAALADPGMKIEIVVKAKSQW